MYAENKLTSKTQQHYRPDFIVQNGLLPGIKLFRHFNDLYNECARYLPGGSLRVTVRPQHRVKRGLFWTWGRTRVCPA
jgi:hypothetical protein